MKKHIPNFITSLNLFSGCIASVMAFNGVYEWVVFWVVMAAVFDFFDGFAARLLHVSSPIGKELDSLADMVSFGLAPSLIVFHFLSNKITDISANEIINTYLPYVAFLLAVFSGLRLAKFNVDERQTSSFIGLPTPANALFWISFIYGIRSLETSSTLIAATLILIVILSYLLIAEIPMFSLKTKSYKLKGNEFRYLLIIFTAIAIILWGVLGIAVATICYILTSITLAVKAGGK